MGVTININNLTLCHKGSGGMAMATLPDVCKTPPGPVPVPYPNIAFSKHLKKGTKTIKVDDGNMAANKGSEFSQSTGDEPGVAGGIKSGTNLKEATWLTYSFDVKLEGRNACRLTDKMFMNHGNIACLGGEIQAPLQVQACCDDVPTPIAPTACNKAGNDATGCDYYQQRHDDYVQRHSCCLPPSPPPPDYYLDYGLKYCSRFTNETFPHLSPEGQAWLQKARCNLQTMMEEGLQNNPELELDAEKFRAFAFDTHPNAYVEAGLDKLPLSDWWQIAKTPDLKEWGSWETLEQAIETGGKVGEKIVEGVGKSVMEMVNEVYDWLSPF